MDVFGINLPNKVLTNFDLLDYAKQLNIPYFKGVFMRDTLPKNPNKIECAIVNLNTSDQLGSHWTCYFKKDLLRIYFDSFGQVTPIEIQDYLKSKTERGLPLIQRNTDIVQAVNSVLCGHLCLFVLKALSNDWSFQQVLNYLNGHP